MFRKLATVVMAVALATAGAACSKSNDANTGTGDSTTTLAPILRGRGGVTAVPKGKLPEIIKPAKIEQVDKSQLPDQAQKINTSSLTQNEAACIDWTIYTTISDNDSSLAESDRLLAGVIGASTVACVPQPKVGSTVVDLLKSTGSSLTDTQAACVKNYVTTASSEQAFVVVGALLVGDQTILSQAATELKTTCKLS